MLSGERKEQRYANTSLLHPESVRLGLCGVLSFPRFDGLPKGRFGPSPRRLSLIRTRNPERLQDWRGFRARTHNFDANALRRPPGEQLPFQPQPPPVSNSGPVKYADLNIGRNIDQELVDRIKAHLRRSPIVNRGPECRKNVTLAEYWMETQGRVVPKQDSWERFYAQIGSCDLYREEAMIDALLADLNKLEIKHTAIMEGGTQVKLILTFDNDKQAVFKPMRFGRDYETDPNHFYFGDFERHTAEIATFHLDRTYSKKTQLAAWQQDMRYCQWKVKGMKQYAHGRRLLDLVDLHLMDYLIGNQDRHHYETFSVFGNDIPSYAIHLDNGRSFGRTDFDDDDILMPFRQCCLIRPRTLNTFFSFYNSPKGLSETLHEPRVPCARLQTLRGS
uniref:Fam20C domain-containing protein n=1 Tax=Globodera pallida TaxID=36090 RepID=A0A183CF71_GLOPA